MTHARYMELKAAFEAFERDGKVETKASHSMVDWVVTFTPKWSDDFDYRPCPKPKVKRWRPWNANEVPLGKELIAKIGGRRVIVTDNFLVDRFLMFTNYTLADGTPCGVEEEVEE